MFLNIRLKAVIACSLCLILSGGTAYADIDAPKVIPKKKVKAAAPLPDRQILSILHIDNQAEINAATLVSDHTPTTMINGFAKQLLKDHKLADSQIKALAGRLGVKLQEQPSSASRTEQRILANHLQAIQDLGNHQGKDFDHAFIQATVAGHEKIIHFMNQQMKRLPKDSPVFDLLRIMLPAIRQHYQSAYEIRRILATQQP